MSSAQAVCFWDSPSPEWHHTSHEIASLKRKTIAQYVFVYYHCCYLVINTAAITRLSKIVAVKSPAPALSPAVIGLSAVGS